MVKRKKLRLTATERAMRRRQAIKNFGGRSSSIKTKRRSIDQVARRKKRRSPRRMGSTSMKIGGLAVGGIAYGTLRARVSSYLGQFTQSIPLGNLSDEAGMLIVNFLVNKNVRNPTVKQVTTVGMGVEFARIGEAISSGQLGLGGNGGPSAFGV